MHHLQHKGTHLQPRAWWWVGKALPKQPNPPKNLWITPKARIPRGWTLHSGRSFPTLTIPRFPELPRARPLTCCCFKFSRKNWINANSYHSDPPEPRQPPSAAPAPIRAAPQPGRSCTWAAAGAAAGRTCRGSAVSGDPAAPQGPQPRGPAHLRFFLTYITCGEKHQRHGARRWARCPPVSPGVPRPPTHRGQEGAEEGEEEEGPQHGAHQRVPRRARGRGGRGVAHGPAPAPARMGRTRLSGPTDGSSATHSRPWE